MGTVSHSKHADEASASKLTLSASKSECFLSGLPVAGLPGLSYLALGCL